MDGIDAQLLQVVDGPWLGQRHELALVLGLGTVDGEVTVVHLIDHDVLPGTQHMLVTLPPCGIGIVHIDHHALLSIDSHSLGKDTRRSHTVDHELVGLPFLVALGGSGPDGVTVQGHRQRVIVQHHLALGIGRSKQFEHRLAGRVCHLVEMEPSILGWFASYN